MYDSGEGISEERQETLFQVFKQQINDKQKNKEMDVSSGVGIGLANSKILSAAADGSIDLRSKKGVFT